LFLFDIQHIALQDTSTLQRSNLSIIHFHLLSVYTLQAYRFLYVNLCIPQHLFAASLSFVYVQCLTTFALCLRNVCVHTIYLTRAYKALGMCQRQHASHSRTAGVSSHRPAIFCLRCVEVLCVC
jgi:hypothetical protein